MAIYLDIQKTSEHGDMVYYIYRTTDDRKGGLNINKQSGEITLQRLAIGDEDEHLFRRAAHKITKHFKDGELPEPVGPRKRIEKQASLCSEDVLVIQFRSIA